MHRQGFRIPAWSVAALSVLLAVPGFAMDGAGKMDPDLPQPWDAKLAEPLLRHSPFTRKVDLSRSLVLTGVAVIEGKLIATVHEQDSGRSYIVTDEPNELGWRLLGGGPRPSLEHTEVQLLIGQERFTLRYQGDQLHPRPPVGGGKQPLPISSLADKNPVSIRRVQLDLTGRQPTPEEIRASMPPEGR